MYFKAILWGGAALLAAVWVTSGPEETPRSTVAKPDSQQAIRPAAVPPVSSAQVVETPAIKKNKAVSAAEDRDSGLKDPAIEQRVRRHQAIVLTEEEKSYNRMIAREKRDVQIRKRVAYRAARAQWRRDLAKARENGDMATLRRLEENQPSKEEFFAM